MHQLIIKKEEERSLVRSSALLFHLYMKLITAAFLISAVSVLVQAQDAAIPELDGMHLSYNGN
jgi:hypothetical protein